MTKKVSLDTEETNEVDETYLAELSQSVNIDKDMLMKNKAALFTSISAEWETPQTIFNELNKIFHFTLDPCCTDKNHKCKTYFTKKDNGLKKKWSPHSVFMNPPYGKVIKDWIQKAYVESEEGASVCCLIPSRTDTKWWHEFCMRGKIVFIQGRLKFINRKLPNYREDGNYKQNAAPFPSALVFFNISTFLYKEVCSNLDQIVFDRSNLNLKPNLKNSLKKWAFK